MTEVWFWVEQTPRKTSFGEEAFVISATVGHKFKRKCLKLIVATEVKRQIYVDMNKMVERKLDGR